MSKKAVVLVSGGLDSSTVLAMANQQGYEVLALSFNYAQNHVIEIEKVKEVIKRYNVIGHKVVNIDLSDFNCSALTNKDLEVPKYNTAADLGEEIPVTYVPARNTIFLSYALGFAEVIGAKKIFLGTHMDDSANYPDCRKEYLESYNKMATLATKVGVEGNPIEIEAPLINMSKAEIVKTGIELGVDYSKTISCYSPSKDGKSCGTCHACLVRLAAFEKNNMQDPIDYI